MSNSSNGNLGLSVTENLRRLRSNVSEEGFEVNKKHRAYQGKRSLSRSNRLSPGPRFADQLEWPSDELREEKHHEAQPLAKEIEAVPEMSQSQMLESLYFNQDSENVEVNMDSLCYGDIIHPLPVIPEVEKTETISSMGPMDDVENVEVSLNDFCNDVPNDRLPFEQKKRNKAFHWTKEKSCANL